MFAVAGVTGHVGSVVAAELLAAGEPVRVIVRDAQKADPWIRRGAQAAVADFADRARLAEALRGARGCFVLLPSDPGDPEPDATQARFVDAVAGAVADSGVARVAMLSSLGGQHAEGHGPVRHLHRLENRLRATPAAVTVVRCCHFQEKAAEVLPAARNAGVYPVFAASADTPVPMVATRDIGGVIAAELRGGAAGTIHLLGPSPTEREVAGELGALLGRTLDVAVLPREAWEPTLVEVGVSPAMAEQLAELYQAADAGLLQPEDGATVRMAATPVVDTLRTLVPSPAER